MCICILETTFCLIYPCEQMDGIVCMYIYNAQRIVQHYHDFAVHLTEDSCKVLYKKYSYIDA